MTRRARATLTDFALRFGVALSFAAFAWSISEIAKAGARPPIPAFRHIEPVAPCAPDRSQVKRFASLEAEPK